jgi:anti-sigma regulatory factor (Ser/Thr protein kinase)
MAALLVSELVTNAVVHARPPIDFTVELDGQLVRMTVVDGDPSRPQLRRRRSPHVNHGRGLQIVDAMAAAWGVELVPGGKAVWCFIVDDEANTQLL